MGKKDSTSTASSVGTKIDQVVILINDILINIFLNPESLIQPKPGSRFKSF